MSIPSIFFEGTQDLGNNGGSTNSYTASYSVGSGLNRILIVGIVGDSLQASPPILVSGVTYGGIAMTAGPSFTTQGAGVPSGNSRATYIFYLMNPPSGVNNIVVTNMSATPFVIMGAADYENVIGIDSPFSAISGSSGTNNLTTNFTTSAAGEWIVLLESGFTNPNPPTSGGPIIIRRSFDGVFGACGLFDTNGSVGPAGTYALSTLRPASTNAIIHVAIGLIPIPATYIQNVGSLVFIGTTAIGYTPGSGDAPFSPTTVLPVENVNKTLTNVQGWTTTSIVLKNPA